VLGGGDPCQLRNTKACFMETENWQKEYLESLFLGVGDELVDADRRTCTPNEPGLIFPRSRNGSIRISEQEAKQLFLYKLLGDGRYRVAVETATCEPDVKATAGAHVDVSLFAPDHNIDTHIEFKHGNGSRSGIAKGLEKLVREEKLGGWFHTLTGIKRGTLPSIARKFVQALNHISHCLEDSEPHLCLFAFCIIDSRRLYLRWLTLGGRDSLEECEQVFRRLTVSTELSSWQIYNLELK
jgi:hypothetical protein